MFGEKKGLGKQAPERLLGLSRSLIKPSVVVNDVLDGRRKRDVDLGFPAEQTFRSAAAERAAGDDGVLDDEQQRAVAVAPVRLKTTSASVLTR
jgi:hypothetical protein